VGAGPGAGFNLNIPWPSDGRTDGDYLARLPACAQHHGGPQLAARNWKGQEQRSDGALLRPSSLTRCIPPISPANMQEAFERVVEPVLRTYDPQILIVAAGFDAVEGDKMGRCHLSPAVFGHLTRRLMAFASGALLLACLQHRPRSASERDTQPTRRRHHCRCSPRPASPLPPGKLLLMLEGGYNVHQTAECAEQCARALLGEPAPALDEGSLACSADTDAVLQRVIAAQARHWPAILDVPRCVWAASAAA